MDRSESAGRQGSRNLLTRGEEALGGIAREGVALRGGSLPVIWEESKNLAPRGINC